MITRLLASSNYLVLNKDLIRIFGLDCAVFLSEIAGENEYWNEQGKLEDGWFYSTIDNVEEHTGLSDFEQRKAINKLQECKIIECKRQGLPAKRYIKINKKQLVKFFKKYILNNSKSSSLKIEELDLDFLDDNNNNSNSNNNSNKNSNNYSEKENFSQKSKRFVKPTIEEIRQYCDERNNGIEAEAFFDFYESKGWKVGQNSMKNWKAAIRNWERQNKNKEEKKMANANNFKVKQYVDLYNSYINNENALFKLYQELHIDVSCIKQLLFIFTYRLNKEKASNALNYIEHFKNWLNTEAGQKAIKDIKLSI